MPNYTLYATPEKYNPLSFLEMWTPVLVATEYHLAIADLYDDLEMKASTLEKLADSAIDQPLYQLYKAYAEQLRQVANDLATQGAVGSRATLVRSDLSKVRKDYAGQIQPIMDAYAARQKQVEEYDKAYAKDPFTQFSINPREVGLGEYMSGSPTVYQVSGTDVFNRGVAAGKQISSNLIKLKDRYGTKFAQFFREDGSISVDTMQAMADQGDKDAQAVINALTETSSQMQSSSDYNYLTLEGKDKIDSSWWQGVNTGWYHNLDKDIRNMPDEGGSGSGEEVVEKPVERTTTLASSSDPSAVKRFLKLSSKTKGTELAGTEYYTVSELTKLGIRDAGTYYQKIKEKEQEVKNFEANAAEDIRNYNNKKLQYQALMRGVSKQNKDFTQYCKDLGLSVDDITSNFRNNTELTYVNMHGLDSSIPAVQELIGKAQRIAVDKKLEAEPKSQKIREYENSKYRLEDLKEGFNNQYKLSNDDIEFLNSLGILEEDYYNDPTKIEGLIYDDTLTYLDSTNEAGKKFRSDLLGSVRRNVLGMEGIEIYQVRDKGKTPVKVKDKKVDELLKDENILGTMVDPLSLKNKAITIKSADGKFYQIPLRYLGQNVLDTLDEPIFPINGKTYSLMDAWDIAYKAKNYTLAHSIEIQIANAINGEFNYNFYLKQSDTKNP